MADPIPIATLELGQFSLSYEDLPVIERTEQPVDGKIYRSLQWPKNVFVYREHSNSWDAYVH